MPNVFLTTEEAARPMHGTASFLTQEEFSRQFARLLATHIHRLDACELCGGTPSFRHGREGFSVECLNCGAKGRRHSLYEDARESWNAWSGIE